MAWKHKTHKVLQQNPLDLEAPEFGVHLGGSCPREGVPGALLWEVFWEMPHPSSK